MNAKILVTGVAVAVLAAGAAAAQTNPSTGSMASGSSTGGTEATSANGGSDMGTHHHARHHAHHHRMAMNERRGGEYAAPQNPIPYAQLDQYMKATPRERMAMEQQANTGNTADTSATAPAASPGPSTGSNMGAAGADNPNQSMAPENSMGSPNTGGPGAMNTNPPVNGATTGSASQTPTMGQGHNGSDAPGTPAAGTPNMSGPNQPQ